MGRFQTLGALWRKLVLLRHPQALLRYLLFLWQTLQQSLFRKRASDSSSQHRKDLTKQPPDRTVDSFNMSRSNHKDGSLVHTTKLPESSFADTTSGTSILIPAERQSRTSSLFNHLFAFSSGLSNTSYLSTDSRTSPNASQSSQEVVGLETLAEMPLGTPPEGNDDSRTTRSSYVLSPLNSHLEIGIQMTPSHGSDDRICVSPTPSQGSPDGVPGHEPEISEIIPTEFAPSIQSKYEGKKLYPTMFINRYERNIAL